MEANEDKLGLNFCAALCLIPEKHLFSTLGCLVTSVMLTRWDNGGPLGRSHTPLLRRLAVSGDSGLVTTQGVTGIL